MEYKSETKNCQNCKNDFVIEPDDFGFYEKMGVPAPTFCPSCRRQRRFAWRNERSLYKRNCDLCKKNIIAMYHESAPFPVYCRECWYGDSWDAKSYGRDYDMNKSFFQQYKEFSDTVPHLALWQRNVVNSEYSNMTGESKNVYLSTSVVKDCENVFFSRCIDKSRDIIDSMNVLNSENLYENVEAQSNYNSQHLLLCRTSLDSYFLVDCVNCSNCFMSYNLRNKEYCIRNKQYGREDYLKEIAKYNLKSRKVRQELLKEFDEIKKKAIYRFANITKSVDATGNNCLNVKNVKECFEIYNAENIAYGFRAFDIKDSYDFDYGGWSELMYEYTTGALNDFNVKFSYSAMGSVRNADYTESCINCTDIFGCISLKNTENAILNKVYSKVEYEKLRGEIIEQMSTVPFVDKMGHKYAYGEFFPIEILPFGYNETLAQEYKPLTKEEAIQNGYPWRDKEIKNFSISIPSDKIPDSIDEVDENVLKEILECMHREECDHQCVEAFRLTDYEFKFYKRYNIPLPVLCPNCRYYERRQVMPVMHLWHRKCMHPNCPNEFETAYSPDRPEIVYCEKCYQQEVY